jgi:hypothetical protein
MTDAPFAEIVASPTPPPAVCVSPRRSWAIVAGPLTAQLRYVGRIVRRPVLDGPNRIDS